MKKKLLCMALATVMALSMTACGGNGEKSEEGKENAKGVKTIEIDLTNEEYAFGIDKNQPELLEKVNQFIGKIKEDGTLDEICEKFFANGEPTPIKSAKLDTSKDQLVVATNAAFEPFEYTKGEDYYGIDMELAALLAEELGQELVIQNMDFDAVCLSVGQQKCDIAMAGLTVNEERQEYVNFTDSYYQASQRVIVPAGDTKFDECKDAAAVEEILNKMSNKDKIGVQAGTTAQYYIEGDEEWGFKGLPAQCIPYKNASLAVQDLINGNITYVMVDAAPAKCITEEINKMQ